MLCVAVIPLALVPDRKHFQKWLLNDCNSKLLLTYLLALNLELRYLERSCMSNL